MLRSRPPDAQRQRVQVVQQRQVAREQGRLLEMLRGAQRRGHGSVDAVQPAVAQHRQPPAALRIERVEGAHAHGVRREQARPLRGALGHAAHERAFEPGFHRIHRIDARAGCGVRLQPRRRESTLPVVSGIFAAEALLCRQHRLREIERRTAQVHVGGAVEIARLERIHHDVDRARVRQKRGGALRHRITAEADDRLGNQRIGWSA